MANEHCVGQAQGCAIRVTRLQANGRTQPGASSMIVSNAIVRFVSTPVYTDGTEIEQKNACGVVCINYKAPDSYKREDVELQICTHDPFLMEMLTDGASVLSDGTLRGYSGPSVGEVAGDGVSIEIWTKRITGGALDPDAPYAWHVWPKVTSLRPGARTFEDGPNMPTFTGQANENPNWVDGPLNDFPEDSSKTYQWIETTTLPDTDVCGYQTVAVS